MHPATLTGWDSWGRRSSLKTPAPSPFGDSPFEFQPESYRPKPGPPCPETRDLLATEWNTKEKKKAIKNINKTSLVLRNYIGLLWGEWGVVRDSTWYCGIRARWLLWLLSNVKTSKTPTQFTRNLQKKRLCVCMLAITGKLNLLWTTYRYVIFTL